MTMRFFGSSKNILLIVICGHALLTSSNSVADEIRVYSGGAPQQILRALTPEFEAATGHKVTFTFALVTAIQQKLNIDANGTDRGRAFLGVPTKTGPFPNSRSVYASNETTQFAIGEGHTPTITVDLSSNPTP